MGRFVKLGKTASRKDAKETAQRRKEKHWGKLVDAGSGAGAMNGSGRRAVLEGPEPFERPVE